MYEERCGLDKVMMSWGHDEYLYQCLVNHGAKIPKEGLYCIRRVHIGVSGILI